MKFKLLLKFTLITTIVLGSYFPNTVLVHAEECTPGAGNEYCLLAPIPLQGAGNGPSIKSTASTYLKGLFQLTIGVATALAVIMIVIGGVEYIGSEAFSSKSAAKKRIQDAFVGLAIAIGAWMILFTVNPRLVEFNLDITPVEVRENSGGGDGGNGTTLPGYPLGAEQINQDTAGRLVLAGNNPPVRVKNGPCMTGGTTGCTNIVGLPAGAINGVNNFASSCKTALGRDCVVIVTGGTEGGHVTHGPNLAQVDLGKNMNVNKYITEKGERSSASCGVRNAPKYNVGGVIYVDEGNHWHACY